MKKTIYYLSLLVILLSCNSTGASLPLVSTDLKPPVIFEIKSSGTNRLTIQTSEPANLSPDSIITSPVLPVKEVIGGNSTVEIIFHTPQEPGKEYLFEGNLQDESENSLTFIAHFYGYNDRVPEILLNEVVTKGSGNNPDFIELYVRKGGNLGGLTLFQGTQNIPQDRLIFPPREVEAGEYLVLTPDDFEKGTGLPGPNGVLTLYTNPNGELLDSLFYTNRTSASDEKYGGFGSTKLKEMVQEIVTQGGWIISGETIKPEDGINSEKTTSTRSICRSGISEDTNSSADWHITPTRGKTPGEPNTDDVYGAQN